MARLLVFWDRPYHLSEAEAEAWVRTEVTRLLATEGIEGARLMQLRCASLRYARQWDWLLELDVTPGDVQRCIESPAVREWLGDLRLLGMRPAAMVADGGRVLGVEEG